jgi:hypothetical protein
MEMERKMNSDHIARCGLYCGVCGVYYATRDKNEKFLQKLLGFYKAQSPAFENLTLDDLRCEGCLSDKTCVFCTVCAIKTCTQDKGYAGCHQCDGFPCDHINHFPVPVGKKVIMRAIPYWREHGTEKWIADEMLRYRCPECGHQLFRGAKRCNQCRVPVDLD